MWPFKSKAEKCVRAYARLRKAELIEQAEWAKRGSLFSEKHVAIIMHLAPGTCRMEGSRHALVNDLVYSSIVLHGYGSSYRRAYADLLSHLADHENMRDVKSLAGWIDICGSS